MLNINSWNFLPQLKYHKPIDNIFNVFSSYNFLPLYDKYWHNSDNFTLENQELSRDFQGLNLYKSNNWQTYNVNMQCHVVYLPKLILIRSDRNFINPFYPDNFSIQSINISLNKSWWPELTNPENYMSILLTPPEKYKYNKNINNQINLKPRESQMISTWSENLPKITNNNTLNNVEKNEDSAYFLVEGFRDYAIFRLDDNGYITSWNAGAEDIFGVKAAAIIGRHFSCLYPAADIKVDKPKQELQLVLTAGQCEDEGWRVRTDGTKFWASSTITTLRDDRGNLLGFSVITHDLTERRKIEEELCQVNRFLRTLSDCNQALVRATEESELLQDIARIIVEVGGYSAACVNLKVDNHQEVQPEIVKKENLKDFSPALSSFYVYSCSSVDISLGLSDFIPHPYVNECKPYIVQNIWLEKLPELANLPNFVEWQNSAREKGYAASIALPLIAKHLEKTSSVPTVFGILTIYSAQAYAFDPEQVKILSELTDDLAYGIMALRTRQERAKAEINLRRERDLLGRIMDTNPAGIVLVDPCGKITFANNRAEQVLGLIRAKIKSGDYNIKQWEMSDYNGNPVADEKLPFYQVLNRKIAVYDARYAIHSPDGRQVLISINAAPLFNDEGEIDRIVATVEDITDQVRSAQALQESEELHRITLSNISDAVFITDDRGDFTYICPNCNRNFGYEISQVKTLGNISKLLGNTIFPVLERLKTSEEIKNLEWRIINKSGGVRFLLVSVKRVAIKGGTILYTCRDITDRKITKEALLESEERYRQLVEVSPEAIAVCAEGKIVLINPAGAKLFGANQPEDLMGKSAEFMVENDANYSLNSSNYAFAPFTVLNSEFVEQKLLRLDKSPVDVEMATLAFNYKGNPGILLVARDVTERKRVEKELQKYRHHLEDLVSERTGELTAANIQLQQEISDRLIAEEALRQSEERLRTLINATPDIVCFKDASGKWLEANEAMLQTFELTQAEYRGKTDLELSKLNDFYREEFCNCHQTDEMAWNREDLSCLEEYIPRSDGTIKIFEVIKVPLFTNEGNRKGIVVLGRDITERKRAEAELERLSRRQELILNSAGEGICGLDLHGNITFVNPAAARMLGYEVKDLIGQTMRSILRVDTWDDIILNDCTVCGDFKNVKPPQITDKVFYRQDGSSFPVEYVSTPMQERGEIVGGVVIFKDITERLAVEKMKNEFVSVVSHELRTPLTSMRGALGLMASGMLRDRPDKAQRMLEIAVANTDRLVRLINDILDIERMTAGKVNFEKQLCSVSELMTQAIEAMQAMAEKSGVILSITPVQASLWADPDRILQTLTNLLSNAIKFSHPGSTVSLKADLCAHEICLKVQDQGRGIPSEKLETIFERFQQVDASDSRDYGGTGLGLAICRSIVDQHGGKIWVESILGQGSTFYVTLPLAKS